jgi:two-component system phosphate regulon sensor histidine kinase PhoR
MKKSLFLKIYTGFVIVIIAMLVVTLLLSYRTIRSHHLKTQRENLRFIAMGLKPTFESTVALHDTARMDSLAKDLGLQTNSRITVIDTHGVVLADSWRDPALMENHGTRPEIMRAGRGEVGTSLRHSATIEEDLLYVAVPLEFEDGVAGVLRVSLRLKSIDDAITEMRNEIVGIALVVALLSLIAALLFSRSFYQPINQLMAASRRVASGDFDARVLLRSGGELGDLAESFNQMTDHIRALFRELSEKSEELNGVVGSLQDGLLVLDRDGRIVLSNPGFKRIAGEAAVEGKFYWEVMQVPEFDALVRSVAERKSGAVKEIAFNDRVYLCSGDYLASREGVVVLVHDVTEMKNVEKLKKDFIVNLSHELRTPLTAIKGFLETLQDEVTVDGRHYLGIVTRHTDRLANIVEDQLMLSELEDSATGLCLEKVDLKGLIEDTLHILGPRAREKNLELILDAPDSGPVIDGDRFKLEQVFINIIDNALKYTETGSIGIRIRENRPNAVITIEDTGVGIGEEHLSRIFERFYVVDKSRSKTVGGTGLGLSIVKHIVLLHNGSIEVESKPGNGTRFTVTIPLEQAS